MSLIAGRQGLRIGTVVAVAVVTLVGASCTSSPDAIQPTAGSSPVTSAPEVVAKVAGDLSGQGTVAAAWVDSETDLNEVWSALGPGEEQSAFGVGDDPPELDGSALLLVSTGESGSCPALVNAVDVSDGRIVMTVVATYEGGSVAGATEIACTADYNPVTFMVAVDPDEVTPPFVLEVDESGWSRPVLTIDAPATIVVAED